MATCGTLTVETADSGGGGGTGSTFDPSAVSLPWGACARPAPSRADPGQTIAIEVTLNNNNDFAADVEMIVTTAAGRELGRTNETVAPGGGTVRVTFPAPSTGGEYDVGVELGSVTQATGDAPRGRAPTTGRAFERF